MAIPASTTPKESQSSDYVASTWRNVMCADNGGRLGPRQSGECNFNTGPRGLSPMTASALGGTATHGQHHKREVRDFSAYIQNQVYDDINSEEERNMDEMEASSPNCLDVTDLQDKSRSAAYSWASIFFWILSSTFLVELKSRIR